MADPTSTETPPAKPSFEEAYPEIARMVARRRHEWVYVSIMPWEDLSQDLLIHVYKKWHQYDPAKGPLENWLNTIITRQILNANRDHHLRLARPCVGGGKAAGKRCEFNKGEDVCSYTPSGLQCAECPVYAEWQRTKEASFHVKSQVSLENHAQEVSNLQCDFIDIAAVRDELHRKMLKELSQWEGKVYRLTIMEHVPPAKASQILAARVKTWKRAPGPQEQYTYSAILQLNRMFRGMMREILRREGHIG